MAFRLPTLTLFAAGALLVAGCGHRRAPERIAGTPPCFQSGTSVAGQEPVRWERPDGSEDRTRLDAWCWAVGAPHRALGDGTAGSAVADSVAVVVWNTHVGGGEIQRFLADLRAGHVTGGRPVDHFVLLLQEVHRGGAAVPSAPPSWTATARRVHSVPPGETRIDVETLAAREGLHVFYAPSMRNGSPGDGGPPEDRGNAILSTLPLAQATAAELPYERQRRVAVFASVEGRDTDDRPWKVRFVSVHLDNRAALSRIHRSFGAAQSNQARGLIAALGDGGATVVGGDLNTWYRDDEAGAVEILQARFASLTHRPRAKTAAIPLLPDLTLDHLFFGLPEGWDARYKVVDDRYASDHSPLVGWVRMGAAATRGVKIVDEDVLY